VRNLAAKLAESGVYDVVFGSALATDLGYVIGAVYTSAFSAHNVSH